MHPRIWIHWTGRADDLAEVIAGPETAEEAAALAAEELLDIPPEELRPLVAGAEALLRRIEEAPAEPFFGRDFAEAPGGLAYVEAGR